MDVFLFVTGPLEGSFCDDGGLWLYDESLDSYENADFYLQENFNDSSFINWEDWINSWDTVLVTPETHDEETCLDAEEYLESLIDRYAQD